MNPRPKIRTWGTRFQYNVTGTRSTIFPEKERFVNPVKTFKVFGEPVEVLVSGEMTNGRSTTLTQVSPPGGGPPPHSHHNEDETFFVVEGDYEFLKDGQWVKVPVGQAIQGMRGSVHTFRNVGQTMGKMLVFVSPAGMEKYLEEISTLSIPDDMGQLLAISERYGIFFPR
jgi:quercetin dioxygenase-like cupin family protein